MLTSILEGRRIAGALPETDLLDFIEFGMKDTVRGGMPRAEAERRTESRAVCAIGIEEATVPGDFPLALGDRLRADGMVLTVDDGAVEFRRAAKTGAQQRL